MVPWRGGHVRNRHIWMKSACVDFVNMGNSKPAFSAAWLPGTCCCQTDERGSVQTGDIFEVARAARASRSCHFTSDSVFVSLYSWRAWRTREPPLAVISSECCFPPTGGACTSPMCTGCLCAYEQAKEQGMVSSTSPFQVLWSWCALATFSSSPSSSTAVMLCRLSLGKWWFQYYINN